MPSGLAPTRNDLSQIPTTLQCSTNSRTGRSRGAVRVSVSRNARSRDRLRVEVTSASRAPQRDPPGPAGHAAHGGPAGRRGSGSDVSPGERRLLRFLLALALVVGGVAAVVS